MPERSPPPSCCASLRQILLHGWQQGFPLHASPFRQMAARSGATPRELLGVCLEMHARGALETIRPSWGAALRRERWRLAFEPGAAAASLVDALEAMPGCTRIERSQTAGPVPPVWADVEALDDAALQRQLDRLPVAPAARLRLPSPALANATPCEDPALAARLEAGLPLCSRPYAEFAKSLGWSEHKLLCTLQTWRRSGHLAGLQLRPPPTRVPQPGVLALWRQAQPPASVLERVQLQSGVERVVRSAGSPAWPWRLSLVLRATPQLAFDQLCELVADTGLGKPDACAKVLIDQPRDHALLFASPPTN